MVDVGGGVGGATQPIARAYPDLRIHIQDLPDSEAGFSKVRAYVFQLTGLISILCSLLTGFSQFWSESYPKAIEEQRVTFSAHNFFKPQPLNCKGAEVYFLRHVIHDWPDAEAIEILSHLAAAMTPFSKLLIVEHVVFPTYRQDDGEKVAAPVPLLANWGAAATSRLDLQVLACLNAKQRTTMEFEELADKSGLRVVRFWKNMGDLAFVECRLK